MKKQPFEMYADNYAASRPGYPDEIKAFLFETFGVNLDSVIVDIACGTGIFTQLLSQNTDIDFAVGLDKSSQLIKAGTGFYEVYSFHAICGDGESVPLRSQVCDLVTVAQGFHWMNRRRSLEEISRILKPGGGVGLVWYRRSSLTEPHQAFIEELTRRYNPNYDPKFMDADYVGMLMDDGRFTGIGQKRFYGSKNFNLKTYIKWQRSKSFIGDAMDPIMLEEFLEKIEKAMRRFFPDGSIREGFKYDLIYGRRKP